MSRSKTEENRSIVKALLTSPRFWIGLVIAVLAIAFIAQNRQPATFHIVAATFTAPHWIMLTAVFLAGLLTGFALRRRK
ncbi:hypothetical protein [Granulicoccus phenolivorans]|uniref:hypothetical protein n=1 Tax=Granulicoccus phenolivorans TaxID=266854 RepID=UPI0004281D35|nr:hypothetical protein [Granulicoccus phenolivorans]